MLRSVGLKCPGLLDPQVGLIGSPVMSAANYQRTLRTLPEERRPLSLVHSGGKPDISRSVLSAIMFFYPALVHIDAKKTCLEYPFKQKGLNCCIK